MILRAALLFCVGMLMATQVAYAEQGTEPLTRFGTFYAMEFQLGGLKGKCIFDSGLTGLVLSPPFAKKLHLQNGVEVRVPSVSGYRTQSLIRSVKGLVVMGHHFRETDMRVSSEAPLDGICGTAILAETTMTFDFKRLTAYSGDKVPSNYEVQWLDAKRDQHNLFAVNGRLGRSAARVIIDTGWGEPYILTSTLVIGEEEPLRPGEPFNGDEFGPSPGPRRCGFRATVSITTTLVLRHKEICFDHGFPAFDAIVGPEYLRDQVLVFDYVHDRMGLATWRH